MLPRFSAKLTWASEEGDRSQDTSGVTPFQMTFKASFVVVLYTLISDLVSHNYNYRKESLVLL